MLCLFYVSMIGSANAALEYRDFSFGTGTPFAGEVLIDGTSVVLTTTNTQPFSKGFRDLLNTGPATVLLEFSQPIKEFALKISYVYPPDEFLTDFNIGLPDLLTGSLGVVDGVVTSTVPGDGGRGELIWSNINTTIISFTIGNIESSRVSPALAIDGFALAPAPKPNGLLDFLIDFIPVSVPSPSEK